MKSYDNGLITLISELLNDVLVITENRVIISRNDYNGNRIHLLHSLELLINVFKVKCF